MEANGIRSYVFHFRYLQPTTDLDFLAICMFSLCFRSVDDWLDLVMRAQVNFDSFEFEHRPFDFLSIEQCDSSYDLSRRKLKDR